MMMTPGDEVYLSLFLCNLQYIQGLMVLKRVSELVVRSVDTRVKNSGLLVCSCQLFSRWLSLQSYEA